MDTDQKRQLAHTDDMGLTACAIRLRGARHSIGLAQNRLAEVAGVGATALQNMEAGRSFPSAPVMRYLFHEHRIDFNFQMNGMYAQLPGDVQERLFEGLVTANNEWGRTTSSDQPRRGRPPKQAQTSAS